MQQALGLGLLALGWLWASESGIGLTVAGRHAQHVGDVTDHLVR